MAGEKYVVATAENPLQIAVRNILNPQGYIFLGNCSDPITLLRLIRSYQPDFVVIDLNLQLRELRTTIETIDDEMLCACVVIGDYKEIEMLRLVEKSKTVSFSPKPLSKSILIHTVELSNINYRRVLDLSKKLKEATETLESRKAIDKAKWILMERHQISEREAYERMRKKSMDSRMSMKAIAEAIIFTYEITEDSK
ncbi:MAG: ANTAR domain-containing protein [Clostridia bacterium]|nr:ANTAR domain-containing protein [Clostridia bacterium]